MATATTEGYRVFLAGKSKGNLTLEQQEYATAVADALSFRNSGGAFDGMILGFREAGPRFCESQLSSRRLVRRAQELRAIAVMPIVCDVPGVRRGGGRRSRDRWQINFVDQAAMCSRRDGVGFFAGMGVDRRRHRRQFDLLRYPEPRGQDLATRSFKPNSVGALAEKAAGRIAEDAKLRAPFDGVLSVARDDLYMRVMLDRSIVFQFDLEDHDRVELIKTSGHVAAHTEIGQLVGDEAVPYKVGLFEKGGKPKFAYVGNTIDATGDVATMELGCSLLKSLTGWSSESDRTVQHSLQDFLPRCYYELPGDAIDNRRELGWTPSLAMRTELLYAVSPDGLLSSHPLQLKAPCDATFVESLHRSSYQVFVLQDGERRIELPAPVCATRLASAGDLVKAGQPIADLVMREYYPSYEALQEASQGAITRLEDALFDALCLRPGDRGYAGRGPAAAAIIAGDALAGKAVDYWLDLTPTMKHAAMADGRCVISHPMPFAANTHGFQFSGYGVDYDFTPEETGRWATGRKPR